MRIISGQHRGKSLVSPEHLPLRPTSNKVRAALFNILRPQIKGATFLDLFAGTGAIGMNALSEGASQVTFVENNAVCLSAIIKNVKQMNCIDKAIIKKISAERFLNKKEDLYYSIIFMDPPYAYTIQQFESLLVPLYEKSPLECLIVVEHVRELDMESLSLCLGFMYRKKDYGHTTLSLLTKS